MTIEEFHRRHEAATPHDPLDAALRRLTTADDVERLKAVERMAWGDWPPGAYAADAPATPAPGPGR